jgi:hypothetical protein
LVVDITTEVLFKGLIGTFGLSVSLRVVGCREFFLDYESLQDELPNSRNKLRATVRDDFGRKAMEFENVGHKEFNGSRQ